MRAHLSQGRRSESLAVRRKVAMSQYRAVYVALVARGTHQPHQLVPVAQHTRHGSTEKVGGLVGRRQHEHPERRTRTTAAHQLQHGLHYRGRLPCAGRPPDNVRHGTASAGDDCADRSPLLMVGADLDDECVW
jgi:hypothetical protein